MRERSSRRSVPATGLAPGAGITPPQPAQKPPQAPAGEVRASFELVQFTGPLPYPDVLRQYEQVLPSAS